MEFSIKEASKRVGISAHTIRYYESEGLFPFIRRDKHGNRVFEQKDLDWMYLMTCFRTTGMKISELKKIVDLALQGDSTIDERKKILEEHKLELQRRQMELDKAFEAVNHKIGIYSSKIQNQKL
ncbi:MerR family transcriptional regulator [Priestia megaterium]|uniref:MerR family transcriptional regulator n=1 Tax=Priestia megaterium TaxID=1404 RepID=UPI00112D87DD|nr:MerR family transcriptional regulator [Priestia megaterium]TPF14265.1 MerR family transcriptional regulator [Priestia megaterium]TPF19574.1 MerR family transcriptional regulator [Priestia megaterium]